jgi:phosphoserine phosphatase
VSLLLTVTGRDRPGVTAALFDVLAEHDVELGDVEQVVASGRLLLGVVIAGPGDGRAVRTAVSARAAELDVEVEFTLLEGDEHRSSGPRHHVTVLGAPLRPAAFAGVARRLAACGANIDRVLRLSSYPLAAYDLLVSGGDTVALRTELAAEAVQQSVDIAVEQATLWRRARRLVVMDVDSTLVQGEVIEMLAAQAGCEAQVADVTRRAMEGELDFEASLRARVAPCGWHRAPGRWCARSSGSATPSGSSAAASPA